MNNLYGKFGMKLRRGRQRVEIYDCSSEEGIKRFIQLIELYGESISDYIKLDNQQYVIIRDGFASLTFDEEENMYHGSDINIGIAAAITAQSRIFMSRFKNNPNLKLYYSDTI